MTARMYPAPVSYDIEEWQYKDETTREWVDVPSSVSRLVRHRATKVEFRYHKDPGTLVSATEWVEETQLVYKNQVAAQWWWLDNTGWHGPLSKEGAEAANEKFGIGKSIINKNPDTNKESTT
jgi:hypothetical protein